MKLKFSLTKKSQRYQSHMLTLLIVFMVLVILMAVSFIMEFEVLGRIAVLAIFGMLLFGFISLRKINRFEIIGLVSFSEDIISINENEYFIADSVKSLEITYKSFKGETSSVTLFGIYEGDNNQISLLLKNNFQIKMTFLSISKNDYRLLKELLSVYRKSGIAAKLIRKMPYQD